MPLLRGCVSSDDGVRNEANPRFRLSLQDADKHEATIEILRRIASDVKGDLPEKALIGAAEELFRDLDTEEADDAPC